MKSEKTHQSINAILLDAYYRDMWCEFSNIDTLYEDYIIHLIGTKGLNMLRDHGRIELCGEIYGRRLYSFDKTYL